MKFGRNGVRTIIGVASLAGGLMLAPQVHAANGPGALFVSGATKTPTHWNIPIGVATAAEIRGVGAEAGSPLAAKITVIIKSTFFGNTSVTATRIGLTNNYAFTYTPPAIANGDGFDACGTTIVAYMNLGQNSTNDLMDDGLLNGSASTAAGFRYTYADGSAVICEGVGTAPATWSTVKRLFN